MKKLFLCAIALIMMLSVSGCNSAGFTVPTVYDSLNTVSAVTVSVKENSITDAGLVLLIANNTSNELSCGMDYTIEQQQDGAWYSMNEEQIFNSLAMLLPPKSERELRAYWEKKPPKGKYRVIKPVFTDEGTQYFSTEFEIE